MQRFKHLTEQELVQSYIDGVDPAISELVSRTKNNLYSVVYLLVKDKYLAEDIAQEAYIKAIKKIKSGQYANDGKFSAWVCRIGRNLCMDHFRMVQSRDKKVVLSDGRDIFDYLDLQDANIEDKLMTEQSSIRVKKLLEFIPQEQRDVIVMRLFGKMSFKEIAEECNVTLNTSLGRMRYGLINLRRVIEERQLVL
jgi:RNA polymerase sigma factor (sigma-70 family)